METALRADGGPAWFALCIIGLVLSAPLARAGTFSATASAGPTDPECAYNIDSFGGSGFESASTGPISCAYLNPNFGGTISSTASASGSWVTGGFATSAVAAANPGNNAGNSITATGSDTFTVNGVITLPSGMASALITFGLTGLSGNVGAGPASTLGGASAGDKIELDMSAGGSTGTSGTSVACLTQGLYISGCPGGGFGLGLVLAPITLTVNDGDDLQLTVSVQSTAFANAYVAPEDASAAITVDPLYLTLPAGAAFDSGITGFLAPEPGASLGDVAAGLGLGLVAAVGRRRERRARVAQRSDFGVSEGTRTPDLQGHKPVKR
jgi:hypothetical protein